MNNKKVTSNRLNDRKVLEQLKLYKGKTMIMNNYTPI